MAANEQLDEWFYGVALEPVFSSTGAGMYVTTFIAISSFLNNNFLFVIPCDFLGVMFGESVRLPAFGSS